MGALLGQTGQAAAAVANDAAGQPDYSIRSPNAARKYGAYDSAPEVIQEYAFGGEREIVYMDPEVAQGITNAENEAADSALWSSTSKAAWEDALKVQTANTGKAASQRQNKLSISGEYPFSLPPEPVDQFSVLNGSLTEYQPRTVGVGDREISNPAWRGPNGEVNNVGFVTRISNRDGEDFLALPLIKRSIIGGFRSMSVAGFSEGTLQGKAQGYLGSLWEAEAELLPGSDSEFGIGIGTAGPTGKLLGAVGGALIKRFPVLGTSVVANSGVRGAVADANFAQPKIRSDEMFSSQGQAKYTAMAGRDIKTVDDLAAALRNGEIHPSQIPVDYVTLDNTNLILNTRTSTALIRGEVPKSDWFGINRTGQVADAETGTLFDQLARDQLSRNAKRAIPGQVGWPTLKPKGLQ